MKIKRFNEELDPVEINKSELMKMIEELEDFVAIAKDKQTYTESSLQELSNYANTSKKGNDQIDDTIISLQSIKKNLDDIIDGLDTSITNLQSYVDTGSSFLLSENK
jgi:chromosome segregation ATPase